MTRNCDRFASARHRKRVFAPSAALLLITRFAVQVRAGEPRKQRPDAVSSRIGPFSLCAKSTRVYQNRTHCATDLRPFFACVIALSAVLIFSMAGCAPKKLYSVPPVGWVLYCKGNQSDPGCRDYRHLERINRVINGRITYEPEPLDQEVWQSLDNASGAWRGDCDDYAMTKRNVLLKQGWSVDRLHLAECLMADGTGHVVLIVDVGGRWLVLDNAYEHPVPFSELPYHWLSIQFGTEWLNYQYR